MGRDANQTTSPSHVFLIASMMLKGALAMSPTDGLKAGRVGTASFAVTKDKSAPSVGSGSVEVFATPMMVAVMEAAACAAIDPHLPETHTSLGLNINVMHTAPTPIGLTVTATANLTEVSGRKLTFEVRAEDGHGEIGSGTHTRIVVDRKRFDASLQSKRT